MMLCRPVTWLKASAFLPFMAGPALSLTCPEQTAELLFVMHQELPESYVMAFGTITLVGQRPQFNSDTLEYKPPGPYRATFSGHLARPSGFDLPARFALNVMENCLGPWCGAVPTGAPAVIFLKKVENGYLLETFPCNRTVLRGPTERDLEILTGCLRKGAC